MSESLSSGMGIFDAKSSESSAKPWRPAILIDSRYIWDAFGSCSCWGLCDGPPCKRTELRGGEAGNAVCTARLSVVELPFGDPARGDDTLRRYSGVGDGGEAGTAGTAGRDCSRLGTNPEPVERDNVPPDTTLALGGDD